MTGRPSSQELADRVREALAIGWPEGDHAEPNVFTDALEALGALAARLQAAEQALREIRDTAEWYARNGERLAHEVDHALCVEVLDTARRALEGAAE